MARHSDPPWLACYYVFWSARVSVSPLRDLQSVTDIFIICFHESLLWCLHYGTESCYCVLSSGTECASLDVVDLPWNLWCLPPLQTSGSPLPPWWCSWGKTLMLYYDVYFRHHHHHHHLGCLCAKFARLFLCISIKSCSKPHHSLSLSARFHTFPSCTDVQTWTE